MRTLPIWDFCRDLAGRLERGEHTVPGLTEAGAAYRADPLIEASADLADALALHEAGQLDQSAVRHEALRVSALACRLWLTALELTLQHEIEVEGDA